MPPKVPVPSKGALRALRHLAIGTTCTVAFSTAIITEERRRRIRAVRVAVENARVIKAVSRAQYSAVVTATLDLEDEEDIRRRFIPDNPPGEVPRQIDIILTERSTVASRYEVDAPQTMDGSKHPGFVNVEIRTEDEGPVCQKEADVYRKQLKTLHNGVSTKPQPFATNKRRPSESRKIHQPARISRRPCHDQPTHTLTTNEPISTNRVINSVQSVSRGLQHQSQIAQTVKENLDRIDMGDADAVEAAAESYLVQFPPFWKSPTLDLHLVAVASKLSNACIRHQKMSTAVKILEILLQSHPDEETFMSFLPDIMIQSLLSSFSMKEGDRSRAFEQAVELFCVKLKEKMKGSHPLMATAGGNLCGLAFQRKEYLLVDKIYWQSQAWCPGNRVIGIDQLILSLHALKKHKEVVDFTLHLLPSVSPNLEEFKPVVRTAMDSAHSIYNKQKREETVTAILEVAADVSRKEGYFFPSSLLSRTLGDHWRTTRDFATSQALFERLKKYTDSVRDPVVLYRAMIQICLEADQHQLVQQYFEEPDVAQSCENDIGCRGHLARGKAMLGNWEGVEEELKLMGSLARGIPDKQKYIYSCFPPILRLFAAHHNITQTEEFLHRCVELYGIVPNQFVSNFMISRYIGAGELDTIPIWIKYAQSRGLGLTATSFNAILHGISKQENNPKLYLIYEQVKAFDASLVDEVTLRILAGNNKIVERLLGPKRANMIQKRFHIPQPQDRRDWRNIKRFMNTAISQGRFERALKIYRSARTNDTHLPSSVLDLAIESVYRAGGDAIEEQVHDLLEDAQRGGQDISWALPRLLVYRLREAHQLREPVAEIVRDAQSRLTARGLFLPQRAVTEAMAILVQRGHFFQAVELWYALSQNEAGEMLYKLDLPILNVLLKAYVRMYDCNGIKWVVGSLVAREIRSDSEFRGVLKDGLETVKIKILDERGPVLEYLEDVRVVLEESLGFVHEHGVVGMVQARVVTTKKVLDIMMDAILRGDDEEVVEKEVNDAMSDE